MKLRYFRGFFFKCCEKLQNTQTCIQTQVYEKKTKAMDERKRKSEMDNKLYMLKKDDLRLQYRLDADFHQKSKRQNCSADKAIRSMH